MSRLKDELESGKETVQNWKTKRKNR